MGGQHPISYLIITQEKTMLKSKTFIVTALIASFAASGAVMAQDTKWEKNHPRREEVNHRLGNQDKRIHEERKEGEISKAQAHKMHREDKKIRQEERDMASQNGGHITKTEQHALNQQENSVSRQIGK
jgi:hypothetical protein